MQYRCDKHGNLLSILGYGCMRFTKKGNSIDIDKAEQEILAAFRAGVNRQRGTAGGGLRAEQDQGQDQHRDETSAVHDPQP